MTSLGAPVDAVVRKAGSTRRELRFLAGEYEIEGRIIRADTFRTDTNRNFS
jgi:hypothetical protein